MDPRFVFVAYGDRVVMVSPEPHLTIHEHPDGYQGRASWPSRGSTFTAIAGHTPDEAARNLLRFVNDWLPKSEPPKTPPTPVEKGRLQVLARDVLRESVEARDEEVRAMATELLELRDRRADLLRQNVELSRDRDRVAAQRDAALVLATSTPKFPTITHVAVCHWGRVWSLPRPARHRDVLRKIAEETREHGVQTNPDDQGFLDSNGHFLSRREAFHVARNAGQLVRQELPSSATNLGELYSEDLW